MESRCRYADACALKSATPRNLNNPPAFLMLLSWVVTYMEKLKSINLHDLHHMASGVPNVDFCALAEGKYMFR